MTSCVLEKKSVILYVDFMQNVITFYRSVFGAFLIFLLVNVANVMGKNMNTKDKCISQRNVFFGEVT